MFTPRSVNNFVTPERNPVLKKKQKKGQCWRQRVSSETSLNSRPYFNVSLELHLNINQLNNLNCMNCWLGARGKLTFLTSLLIVKDYYNYSVIEVNGIKGDGRDYSSYFSVRNWKFQAFVNVKTEDGSNSAPCSFALSLCLSTHAVSLNWCCWNEFTIERQVRCEMYLTLFNKWVCRKKRRELKVSASQPFEWISSIDLVVSYNN